jgi:hypothetical protein
MAIGLIVPYDADLAAALLRYYWFRLSDVMVPLGVALLASGILRGLATSRPAWHAAALIAALAVAGAHLGDVMWRRHLDPRPPADSYIANQGAWLEACDWIARETPPDALFLTPRLAQTFRWYAPVPKLLSLLAVHQALVE